MSPVCGREFPFPLLRVLPRKTVISAIAEASGFSERKVRKAVDRETIIRCEMERARILEAQARLLRAHAARLAQIIKDTDAFILEQRRLSAAPAGRSMPGRGCVVSASRAAAPDGAVT